MCRMNGGTKDQRQTVQIENDSFQLCPKLFDMPPFKRQNLIFDNCNVVELVVHDF